MYLEYRCRMYTHVHTHSCQTYTAPDCCTSRVLTYTAVYTQLQLQLYSSIRDQPILSEHSVHVYRPMRMQVLNFSAFACTHESSSFMNHVYCKFVNFYIMKIVSHWCDQASTARSNRLVLTFRIRMISNASVLWLPHI